MPWASAERKSSLTLVKTTILVTLLGAMLFATHAMFGIHAACSDADETSGPSSSVLATWKCTGAPCPWGEQTAAQAAVWPVTVEPIRVRYGYTVSDGVYAAAARVVGWEVAVTAGSASVYAGAPNESHATLASLEAGQSFTVPALRAGALVSVQGGSEFRFTLTPGPQPTGGRAGTLACTNPTVCDPVSSVASVWRYTGPDSNPGDWAGGVIAWPSWSAYSTNSRHGLDARAVYSTSGGRLYPYMGEWADGCKIKVVSGGVLVIEWQRGKDEWRETLLSAGDAYTINLSGSENSAMIETPNNLEPFKITLSSCAPRQIDKTSAD